MKITKFLFALGMVMSAGLAHADVQPNCAAHDASAAPVNPANTKRVVTATLNPNDGQGSPTSAPAQGQTDAG